MPPQEVIDYYQRVPTWHANPCPNPKIPPLAIELADISIPTTHDQYVHAKAAVEAYWRQATNMTDDEQHEYKRLLDKGFYIIITTMIGKPSNHRLYKACRQRPTWAKFVFIHAIYPKMDALDQSMLPLFQSLEMNDLESTYRQYCPVVVKGTTNKRKSTGTLSGRSAQRQKTAVALSSATATTTTSNLSTVTATTLGTPSQSAQATAGPAASSSPNMPRPRPSSTANRQSSLAAVQGASQMPRRSIWEGMENRLMAYMEASFTGLKEEVTGLPEAWDYMNKRITLAMEMIETVRQDVENVDDKVDKNADDLATKVVPLLHNILNLLSDNN